MPGVERRLPSLTKRVLLVTVIAAVAGAAIVLWVWRSKHPADDPNRLTLYGNVDIRQVSLAFNASERIAELRVKEGDKVRAGDVLGVLDMRTPRVRLAQTEAQIGVQDQALLRLKNGSRPEEVAQARASLAAAEAEAGLAALQVARLQATSDATAGKAVGQQDLDNARAHQKVALAQAEAARQAAALVAKGPRQEDIAQATKQLAVAHTEQALIQRQIEESTLRAPADAVVRARLLEPGDMASPQRPVFTLAITEPKWVRAYVAEPQLGRLQPGMAATVSTDSEPGRGIPARLGYISSVAEFTPKTVQTPELRTSLVYELRFMVDDPQDRLRLGMPATVHLPLLPAGETPAAGR
ncbi:MAG: HlyD family efflux transporter periplasmic adaptor subunit [Rhodoferax sp.]|nr:HlyD family efflux transporter periplasmic adaptor subunit [Rhodoferax sp.]